VSQTPPETNKDSRAGLNIGLLFTCEALVRTVAIINLTTMALIGRLLAPQPALITVPLALVSISTMLWTIPAARLMRRKGRAYGFTLGATVGLGGALLCAGAVFEGSFALLCLGAAGLGGLNGAATYHRFAAAEAAAPSFRSRALSLVLAGGVVAAFLGAFLATSSRSFFPQTPAAGAFVCIAVLLALYLLVMAFTSLPASQTENLAGEGRRLALLVRQPRLVAAVLGSALSWGVMSLLMNITPLSMERHHHAFADTALVIQWHVLGMYIPSFFTGHLVRLWGERRVVYAGLGLLFASVFVNLAGYELLHYTVGLTLLGLGWNLLFIGSTSLLTLSYRPEEKTRVQSLNDLLVFAAMVLATSSAGLLENHLGWHSLNLYTLPLLGVATIVLVFLLSRPDPKEE
jgi:MFS family permease